MPRDTDSLVTRYCEVRRHTEALAAPLGPEDQTVQTMPDVSPTKWHRAHVTWFFETFVLGPHVEGYRPHDATYAHLFNSYYESVGSRHPRAERGHLSRPGVAAIARYRATVDQAMLALLAAGPLDPHVAALIELGLHHEQQHQELLLMDIKHVLSCNPLLPAYVDDLPPAAPRAPSSPTRWLSCDGGLQRIGHDGDGFAFDNEAPRHLVWLEPYALADRLVTCGEWRAFIDDGGYRNASLWLSDGWATVQREGWDSPAYWQRRDGGWDVFTLPGCRPVVDEEPVCHVSYYEADAFARWAGARLPTEAEWEHAASAHGRVDTDRPDHDDRGPVLHPRPCADDGHSALHQLTGEVWQWTASPYSPYPGFVPPIGAVGEYNGKFMANQMVLRGGACITPPGHTRRTYRNFFYPHQRWPFAGLRLARSA